MRRLKGVGSLNELTIFYLISPLTPAPMPTSLVTVTTAATLLIAANPKRIGLVIDNQSAGNVFLGDDSSLTTSTGITIASGDKYVELPPDNRDFYYWGDYYGIVASGTAAVHVMELIKQE